MFQSKQHPKSNFICDGPGDFIGITRKTEEPMEMIKIKSNESVKSVALLNEIPSKRRNVQRSLESKFNLSGISASPLDKEVTLHPEEDTFQIDATPAKMKKAGGKKKTASCNTHHKVQPSQELQDMKWALEEKIAKEKEAIAIYQHSWR